MSPYKRYSGSPTAIKRQVVGSVPWSSASQGLLTVAVFAEVTNTAGVTRPVNEHAQSLAAWQDSAEAKQGLLVCGAKQPNEPLQVLGVGFPLSTLSKWMKQTEVVSTMFVKAEGIVSAASKFYVQGKHLPLTKRSSEGPKTVSWLVGGLFPMVDGKGPSSFGLTPEQLANYYETYVVNGDE